MTLDGQLLALVGTPGRIGLLLPVRLLGVALLVAIVAEKLRGDQKSPRHSVHRSLSLLFASVLLRVHRHWFFIGCMHGRCRAVSSGGYEQRS